MHSFVWDCSAGSGMVVWRLEKLTLVEEGWWLPWNPLASVCGLPSTQYGNNEGMCVLWYV